MKTVQIKVLRDNLSKYLKLVKEGEVVLVKERNTIIAELKPPSLLYDTAKEILESKENFWSSDLHRKCHKGNAFACYIR